MRAGSPLLSALLPQKFKPPLQPSAVNLPPFFHILDLPLQQDVPPLQPIVARAPPPLLSVFLQGQFKPPLLPSTVRAYVPLLSALLLLKGVPICQPSDEPDPIPHISA